METIPRKIVADRGTENVKVAIMQRFLRRNNTDSMAGEQSFTYGRSVANQRIEAFWSQLRRQCTGWWMEFFKEMIMLDELDNTNESHIQILRFIFGPLLKKEIDDFKALWNSHYIRKTSTTDPALRPNGRPDMLYFTPNIEQGVRDYKFGFDSDEYAVAVEDCCVLEPPSPYFCSDEFQLTVLNLMDRNNLTFPKNASDGKTLFLQLVDLIGDNT